MPYDEADLDDPQELVGVAVPEGDEDEMARVFVEEYVRAGCTDEDLWRMFKSSFYAGLHRILRKRGERYVGLLIEETRARWGYWRTLP
jgi:hypothetical protein